MTPETLALVEASGNWLNAAKQQPNYSGACHWVRRLRDALLAETKRADEAEARVAGMVEALEVLRTTSESGWRNGYEEDLGRPLGKLLDPGLKAPIAHD